MRGFAALFVPVTAAEDTRDVSFETVERLADCRVRLTVSVDGGRREVVTGNLALPDRPHD
jgi:imidazole glycerol phosphate synthase subunit HisF